MDDVNFVSKELISAIVPPFSCIAAKVAASVSVTSFGSTSIVQGWSQAVKLIRDNLALALIPIERQLTT